MRFLDRQVSMGKPIVGVTREGKGFPEENYGVEKVIYRNPQIHKSDYVAKKLEEFFSEKFKI